MGVTPNPRRRARRPLAAFGAGALAGTVLVLVAVGLFAVRASSGAATAVTEKRTPAKKPAPVTERPVPVQSPAPPAAPLSTDTPALLRVQAAIPGDTALAELGTALQDIAETAGGAVGLAIVHAETGARISIRGQERFPMASVYKLPIALQLLHEVSCDVLSLEDTVRVKPADLRTGSGWIWARHRRIPVLTVRELLGAMMIDSDNTASDLLMRKIGGPEAVTARLRTLGITNVRVDRYEAVMALDYGGVTETPPDSTWTIDALWNLKKDVPLAEREVAARSFLEDPRDTATPDAMADLLLLVLKGRALGSDETSRLLEIMERSRTGPDRIRGLLPEDVPVAHKTGTWSTSFGITAAVNDVGIVMLPRGAGHLVVVVFVKGSQRGPRRIERTIAALSRAAFDHWTAPPARAGGTALPTRAGRGTSPSSAAGPQAFASAPSRKQGVR